MNKATEWTPSPRDFRTTITTTDGVYEMTENNDQPFARIGKVDANNIMVVDSRSEKAIEASNSIIAYSLKENA